MRQARPIARLSKLLYSHHHDDTPQWQLLSEDEGAPRRSDMLLHAGIKVFNTASDGLAVLLCLAMHRCPNCESKLLAGANYCVNCGRHV
jgi:hypothetical protein